jgi:hypothetical protein
MEIDLKIFIIKVIKSSPEIFKHREVASLVHQELIEIMKKVIIHLMKEIIIKKVLITEVTNIVTKLEDNKVIQGKKIIITKINQITTDLEI